MTQTRRAFLATIAASAAVFRAPVARAASGVSVVATTGMIADTARAIAGDLAQVTGLMGPGIDPHSYRQTRSDIVALARADLVLWNGLYLEAQMEEVMADIARRTSVVPVGEAVPDAARIAHDDYANRYDPHVWMDPSLWRLVTQRIAEALADVDPENAETYSANAEAYLAQLDDVAAYAKTILATVPADTRVLVTAHDAFNYFGRAYDFDVVGIQGISTESEAGLARIRDLVDLIVERGVGAVFVESSVSDRSIRALIEGAQAKGHDVRIGGELFSDAMGEPGTYEGTYLGMIDHNATTIATALGGDAPAQGFAGRLSAES